MWILGIEWKSEMEKKDIMEAQSFRDQRRDMYEDDNNESIVHLMCL